MKHHNKTSSLLKSLGVFLLLLCFTIVIVVKVNYSYGRGNHGETIPIHSRIEDPTYLVNDYFVNSLQSFNVRSSFSYLMFATHKIAFDLPYNWIYFLYFVLTTNAIAIGLFKIFTKLGVKRHIALVALAFIFFTIEIELGSTYLITSQLLPSSFAAALGIWGFYLMLQKRHLLSIILLGLASYFQLVIGLQSAIIILIVALFEDGFSKDTFIQALKLKGSLAKVLQMGIFYLFLISPLAISIFARSELPSGFTSADIGYLIGEFRNPHHYIPSYWEAKRIALFFFFDLIAIATAIINYIKTKQKEFRVLLIILAVLNCIFFIGYFFVEVVPISLAIKFQFYRTSFYLDIIVKLLTSIGLFEIVDYVSAHAHSFKLFRVTKKVVSKGLTMGILVILPLLILIQNGPDYIEKLQNPRTILSAYQWISENTDKNALIIVDPFVDNFRLDAKRATIVTFKTFMFKDGEIAKWYLRLQDLCGMKKPVCNGWGCRSYCEEKYNSYGDKEFEILANKYHADYIITSAKVELTKFEQVYEDPQYRIYKIGK